MADFKVSYRYAASLLETAEDKNVLEKTAADAEFIKHVLEENPDLKRALENPVIKQHIKKSIMVNIFKSSIDEETMRFVEFIIHKNREDLVYDIFLKFLELYNEKLGVVDVEVKTAFDLDDDQKEKLKEKLQNYLNKKTRISFQIDKEIIGGFIAKVGDTIYDASLKHQLVLLKKQFLSGSLILN
jgi:F-type H+-transporting ATPase subunit delta